MVKGQFAEMQQQITHMVTAIKAGVLSESLKQTLAAAKRERARFQKRLAHDGTRVDKLTQLLPNVTLRFKRMIDELATMTLPQVHKARTILRKLVGRHITLHPSADGTERFSIAELASNYAGLVRVTLGILELAEACDLPVRWSCRTGVCHSCESGLVSGAVVYGPEPLEKPAAGNVLVCCSQPIGDAVIDL